MDPYERLLRDEVLYLHSLWHQGPPRMRNPNPCLWHNSPKSLRPCSSTAFKKETIHKNKWLGRICHSNTNNLKPECRWPTVSDVEWPCAAVVGTSPTSPRGWPDLKPQFAPLTSVSAEEKARLLAVQIQQNGLKACVNFFNAGSDSDADTDDEDEDDLMDEDCGDQCEEFKLFMKIFSDFSDLRTYYKKNNESGYFYCLVCGGAGKNVRKRFKDCVALVQHSISISKTKKKKAHRAFGQVICELLGWDIKRLPTIFLCTSSKSSGKAQYSQEISMGDSKDNAGVVGSGSDSALKDLISMSIANSEAVPMKLPSTIGASSNVDSIRFENELVRSDACKDIEEIDKGVSDMGLCEDDKHGV